MAQKKETAVVYSQEELAPGIFSMWITKDQMCLIGDTEYDVIGANQFGIRCIGVSYGFGKRELLERAGAYCVCDNMAEVVDALQQM